MLSTGVYQVVESVHEKDAGSALYSCVSCLIVPTILVFISTLTIHLSQRTTAALFKKFVKAAQNVEFAHLESNLHKVVKCLLYSRLVRTFTVEQRVRKKRESISKEAPADPR